MRPIMDEREQERLDTIQAIWDYLRPYLGSPKRDGGELATMIYDTWIEPLTVEQAEVPTNATPSEGDGDG